jgi:hypothetical protein
MPIIQFLINKYEIFVHFATFFILETWTVSGFTEKRDTDSDTMDPKHCW